MDIPKQSGSSRNCTVARLTNRRGLLNMYWMWSYQTCQLRDMEKSVNTHIKGNHVTDRHPWWERKLDEVSDFSWLRG